MENTTHHPLSQALIQQASVIIGHRQEIRGIYPLGQEDIERECARINAASPKFLKATLENYDGSYCFSYRIKGQDIKVNCTESEYPSVALFYGEQALKHLGIDYKFSFPKPIIKDLRQPPYTLAQEISARRELGVLFINFKIDVDEALASAFQIDSQLSLLEAILNDFESADWDDEVAGGILAYRAIEEAQEWVENQYYSKTREIDALPDDERQRRNTPPRNFPHKEENDTPTRRITLAELALIEIYEGRILDIEAANRLVRKNGFSCGQKLLSKFDKFRSPGNRTGFDKSRERNYMVKYLKQLLPLLSEKARQKAEKELQTLMARTNYKD